MASTMRLMAACAGFERLHDLFLGDFLGARLDHHHAIVAAGDDQIERLFLRCS